MELEVLKAIEMELPLNIPVKSFFDLIVGTRFVYRTSFLSPSKYWKHGFYDSMDVLGLCIVCPATSLVLITRG